MAIYATGSLIAQPVAGRLSDARGRRNVFLAALSIFMVGSLVCAIASSLGMLIAGRVVQSLGAGALQPAAIALVGQRVPKDRQSSALYALYGMFALAGALGAVLGGVLIDSGKALGSAPFITGALRTELTIFPWHVIFWVNIPIALVALALGLRLADDRPARAAVGLDGGAILIIPIIAYCLMMAANGSPDVTFAFLAAALVALALLAWWETKAKDAFFEPSLFKRQGPLLLYAIAILSGIPIFAITMYSAAYFMTQFNATAASAGVALLALALPLGAGQGVGGRLTKRLGSRSLLAIGITALVLGDGALAGVHTLWGVLGSFALAGFGIGLASAPPNALLLRYVDAQQSGAATGLLTMLSSAGAITAPAAVTAFLHFGSGPPAGAFRSAYLLSSVLALLALPLAVLLPPPDVG